MLSWLFDNNPVTFFDIDHNIIGKPLLYVLRQCACFVRRPQHQKDILALKEHLDDAQMICDVAWEHINTGHWKFVNICWRRLYSYGALFKSYFEVQMEKQLTDALKSCDLGLIMGAPVMGNVLTKVATEIHSHLDRNICSMRLKHLTTLCPDTVKKAVSFPIPRVECPSLEKFVTEHLQKEVPVVIVKAIDYWPAMTSRQWSIEYILRCAGGRTVPVEVGTQYTDESWSQTLMTLADFVQDYILSDEVPHEIGYLAQHQLFDQIPELREDISIPIYCCLSEKDEEPDINVWFGPKGTTSPLHHDPKHNLLTQVFGEKYIRLYSKEQTQYLFPHESHLLDNTSQVDVENPDLDKFPSFSQAKYTECVLSPGEMLYIPPKCWHFVKSLSPSMSLSFWWE
uniref:JmjC domain-containing protein 5 n=1 Tax=Ornithodoros moubata TaxID=6938 RepID=A0A1Z5KWR7_ORNMO